MYLHELKKWEHLFLNANALLPSFGNVCSNQGALLGLVSRLDSSDKSNLAVDALVDQTIAASLFDGIDYSLNSAYLAVNTALQHFRHRDFDYLATSLGGMATIQVDAVLNANAPVDEQRLFGWQNALFPTGFDGMDPVALGQYRQGPMSVVSGEGDNEVVHYEAPDADAVPELMQALFAWIASDDGTPAVLRAAEAHLRFQAIHPFDEGNSRICWALTSLLIARGHNFEACPGSLAAQVVKSRRSYYDALFAALRGTRDITEWCAWFMRELGLAYDTSIAMTESMLSEQQRWATIEGSALSERQREMLLQIRDLPDERITAREWAQAAGVSADTALRDINDLVDKGLLSRSASGGRSTHYTLSV